MQVERARIVGGEGAFQLECRLNGVLEVGVLVEPLGLPLAHEAVAQRLLCKVDTRRHLVPGRPSPCGTRPGGSLVALPARELRVLASQIEAASPARSERRLISPLWGL